MPTSHHDNLKTVIDACIAANPEIAELKFGCRVRITNLNGKKSVWELVGDVDTHSNQDRIWRNVDSEFATVEWGNFKLELLDGGTEVEVLGREITLPDVLLALEAKWPKFNRHMGTMADVVCRWNLRLPLSGQSEDCIQYLANLLK